MWVGTAQSNIYKASLGDLKAQLMTTCHYDRINDVAYPQYVVLRLNSTASICRTTNLEQNIEIWETIS